MPILTWNLTFPGLALSLNDDILSGGLAEWESESCVDHQKNENDQNEHFLFLNFEHYDLTIRTVDGSYIF